MIVYQFASHSTLVTDAILCETLHSCRRPWASLKVASFSTAPSVALASAASLSCRAVKTAFFRPACWHSGGISACLRIVIVLGDIVWQFTFAHFDQVSGSKSIGLHGSPALLDDAEGFAHKQAPPPTAIAATEATIRIILSSALVIAPRRGFMAKRQLQ
jgi:hypothetical protein